MGSLCPGGAPTGSTSIESRSEQDVSITSPANSVVLDPQNSSFKLGGGESQPKLMISDFNLSYGYLDPQNTPRRLPQAGVNSHFRAVFHNSNFKMLG